MHPRVFQEFEQICMDRNAGGSVLEIGAIPSKMSLLCMDYLKNASEKVGINIDGPHHLKEFTIVRGNANSMEMFTDDRFDLVLSNATLEHDMYFWKTIKEIHRVTKPGGIVVIGVPGYTTYTIEKFKKFLGKFSFYQKLALNRHFDFLFTTTLTFQIHDAPGDYYRFSEQTVKEVFFQDFEDVEVRSIMSPPRIIGAGRKSQNSEF